ncbi:hypothetical protein N7468_006721 [Penicillium chermesinum]|uniref:Thioredoxin n=1 Tax=Penicillium chermesinum TaxID=63820 RepID=A0A9W9NSR2_9EURO|nr:uncharacterized protein N7468_006721 [Penicillium chermesinum]KAJ5225496.1 hypothetical protein N7468_006721 [Penicillium chermesinum]
MSVVEITSNEQFNSLLSQSRFVVADFYADWCGPCKAIAPVYASLASQLTRPNHITFTKINGDNQQALAQAYSVRATAIECCSKLPFPPLSTIYTLQLTTTLFFLSDILPSSYSKTAAKRKTVAGADARKLNEVIQKLASEAKNSDAAGGEGSGSWVGAAIAKGYSDVTDQVDVKGLDLLNRDSEHGGPRVLFDSSKPAALAGKGKKADADWVESDTDEQLMLYIPRATMTMKFLCGLKTLWLYTNRSHVLGFDEAEDIPAVQKLEIQEGDWDAKTATAKVDLRFVKFQNVTSLVVFFVDGDGAGEKLRVDRLRIIGEAGEKRSMGKLEKFGDEPGE